jgi:hypothetical protein
MVDLPRIVLPFLIAFLQMITGALSLGFIPALCVIGARKEHRMLFFWIIFWLCCIAAVTYGLPKAMHLWKDHAQAGFKYPSMYMGYFVGLFAAFFLMPEPLRQARDRLRNDRYRPRPQRRRRRRRSQQD